MKFWDSSAVVPLLIEEEWSAQLRDLTAADRIVAVSMITSVEVISSIWRRVRSGAMSEIEARAREERFDALSDAFVVIADFVSVSRRARRLLPIHSLRASDSIQLASALFACDERPQTLPFVTLDARLAEAARREGFRVEPEAI